MLSEEIIIVHLTIGIIISLFFLFLRLVVIGKLAFRRSSGYFSVEKLIVRLELLKLLLRWYYESLSLEKDV